MKDLKGITFRKMQLSDTNQVVNVHLSSFRGFFLSSLGPKFLDLLYAFIASSPDGVGFVAVDNSQVVGFVCGSMKPLGFYRRFFFKKWREIIFSILLSIIRNPSIVPRLVWRLVTPPQASAEPGTATLMSIAILPEYQNKGIGKVLIQEFLNEMKKCGMQRVNLTTDRDNNDAVNAFYQRMGFQLVRSFVTPEGRWMNEYIIELENLESK
ncbi:MAG: GNAT family N-acetyltransferase [Candidatus Micrarchaeia archaeon]